MEGGGAYGSRNVDRHERMRGQEDVCQSEGFGWVLHDVSEPRDQPAQAEVILAL